MDPAWYLIFDANCPEFKEVDSIPKFCLGHDHIFHNENERKSLILDRFFI